MGLALPRPMSTVNIMIEKLGRLLRARFGAELSYQKFGPEQQELHDQLLIQSPLKQADKWLFPVFREYQLVGCAILTGIDQPLETMSEQLSEFVDMYLDAAVALTDRVDLLDSIERQMNRSSIDAGGGANVIPMRKPTIELPDHSIPRLRRRARLGFALPCLLEGPTDDDLKHLALELHELSGRYAFVYLKDLAWSKAADLMGLGPVTLFIPDIAKLTLQEQIALTEYLQSRPSVGNAQIVAATVRSYADISQSGAVTMDLLHLMSVCYMKMDRPFREYRREGIVEFFFGSLIRDDIKGNLN